MLDWNDVTFLLGSGVSDPSGMPNVSQITEAIYEKNRLRAKDESKVGIDLYSPLSGMNYPILEEATKSFLVLMGTYCDQHLMLRGFGRANYEDLYYLGKQIVDFVDGEYDNPALLPFFHEIQTKLSFMEANLNQKHKTRELPPKIERLNMRELAGRCLDQIEATVAEKLKSPNEIVGFDLLHEILDQNANAFLRLITLNHDLLLETELQSYGVVDGFEENPNGPKCFSPTVFDQARIGRVLILKPHGSIDWWRYNKGGVDRYCKCSEDQDKNHAKDKFGEALGTPHERMLLAGTTNKEISYGRGLFSELLFQVQTLLKESRTLIVSGYGFRDKGINNRIWAWLPAREENRLIILHNEDKRNQLFSDARTSLSLNFDRFRDSGKIRIIGKWLCETNLDGLVDEIQ